MSWFDRIKFYYEEGLWDKQRVRNVVGKVITEEQYLEITGEIYQIRDEMIELIRQKIEEEQQ